jgi:carbon monoxide dehydrogenase subunit G
MPEWELSIEVDAGPDAVWAFVGDPTTVPRWYPKYVACQVEGDTRRLRSAEGAELVERLLERDDERRAYSYSVLSGAPVRAHRASFEVVPAGAGSRIVWRTEAEPADPSVDMRARLEGTQTDALRRIKEIVEAGAPG